MASSAPTGGSPLDDVALDGGAAVGAAAAAATPAPAKAGGVLAWLRNRVPALPNPGKFEEFNLVSKDVISGMELFDGFKLDIFRGVTQNAIVGHSIKMGAQGAQPSYAFNGNYVSEKLQLLGQFDSGGSMMGRAYYVHPRVILGVIGQTNHELSSIFSFEGDFIGNSNYAQVKVQPAQAFVSATYCQSVTPKVATGTELTFSDAQGFIGIQNAIRYRGEKHELCANAVREHRMGHLGVGFNYTHNYGGQEKYTTELAFGKDPERNKWVSEWTFGYHMLMNYSNVKATINSHGKISSYYEVAFNPNVKLIMSGQIDYTKKDYKFGYGIGVEM